MMLYGPAVLNVQSIMWRNRLRQLKSPGEISSVFLVFTITGVFRVILQGAR